MAKEKVENKNAILWNNLIIFKETKSMLEEILELDKSIEIKAYSIIEGGKNVRAPYMKIDGFDYIRKSLKVKIFHPKGIQHFDIFCDLRKAVYIEKYIKANFIKEVVYREMKNKK